MIPNKDKASSYNDTILWKIFGYEYDFEDGEVQFANVTKNSTGEYVITLAASSVDTNHVHYFVDLTEADDTNLSLIKNSLSIFMTSSDTSLKAVELSAVEWNGSTAPSYDRDVYIIFHDDKKRLIKLFSGTSNERIIYSDTCLTLSYKANTLDPYCVIVNAWGDAPDYGVTNEYVRAYLYQNRRFRYEGSSYKEISCPYTFIGDASTTSASESVACDMMLMMPGQKIRFTANAADVYKAKETKDSLLDDTSLIGGIYEKAYNHRIIYVDRNDAKAYVMPVVHIDNESVTGGTSAILRNELDYDSLFPNYNIIRGYVNGVYNECYPYRSSMYGIDGILEYLRGVNACDGNPIQSRRSPDMRIITVNGMTYDTASVTVKLPNSQTFSSVAMELLDTSTLAVYNSIKIHRKSFSTLIRPNEYSYTFIFNRNVRVYDNLLLAIRATSENARGLIISYTGLGLIGDPVPAQADFGEITLDIDTSSNTQTNTYQQLQNSNLNIT